MKNLKPIKALLFDMDGVLYHGSKRLPHVLEFLASQKHLPWRFITNNPILSPSQIVNKLKQMDILGVDESQIITSAMATGLYLCQLKKDFSFYAIGAPGLKEELLKYAREDKDNADFVVVGEGPGLDYDSLTIGINLILQRGAKLIGTNPDISVDAFIDGKHQVLAGGGALIAPLAKATNQEPIFIGKPAPLLYEMAINDLRAQSKAHIELAHCLMIGDRPDTDIHGAAMLGMQTALVRTGRFGPEDNYPEEFLRPDFDCKNLLELKQRLSE